MSVPPAILPETTCTLKYGRTESVPMRLIFLVPKMNRGLARCGSKAHGKYFQ